MKIINYFEQTNETQNILKEQLPLSEWRAAHYLHDVLNKNTFMEKYGRSAKLFMLVDDSKLMAFCTLAERDEIEAEDLSPWIGFVYTYPAFRGHRYSEQLINFACDAAKRDGCKQVFISSEELGLYEKYGFEFIAYMKTIWGEDTQVFSREL